MMNPNRKRTRGPKKPLRVPAPKPVVEYSERGRRIVPPEELTPAKAADEKKTKRSFSVDTVDGEGSQK
jgi:hypothetical protein